MSISKRTTVAFAFAYAWPCCTKNLTFCTNKHEHKQQSAALNCQKIRLWLFELLLLLFFIVIMVFMIIMVIMVIMVFTVIMVIKSHIELYNEVTVVNF
jgi:fatty acid desaturase